MRVRGNVFISNIRLSITYEHSNITDWFKLYNFIKKYRVPYDRSVSVHETSGFAEKTYYSFLS